MQCRSLALNTLGATAKGGKMSWSDAAWQGSKVASQGSHIGVQGLGAGGWVVRVVGRDQACICRPWVQGFSSCLSSFLSSCSLVDLLQGSLGFMQLPDSFL